MDNGKADRTDGSSGGKRMSLKLTMPSSRTRLVSKSYSNEMICRLRSLQQSDTLCDFTVSAEGKSLRVHKCLLASTSDFFRAMLCGSMKESKENSVDLHGLRAASLQTIVDFIYSGEMLLDRDSLVDTLDAACQLQIHSALDLCSDYIISLLTFANADEFVRIAETYSLERVGEFYTQKILMEFEEFVLTRSFLNMSFDQLTECLKDDRLRVKSECQLIDAIFKWCAYEAKRLDRLSSLITCVRFGLMSKSQLQALAAMPRLSQQCTMAKVAIEAALDYHHTIASGKHPSLADDPTAAKIRASDCSLVLIHQGSSLPRPFEVVVYDSVTSRFYSLLSNTDGGRDCRVVAAAGFAYILRVADSGGGALLNALLRFDPRHLTLSTLTPSRRLRLDPAVACFGRQIYVFGGNIDEPSQGAGDTVLDAVERYDITTDSWSVLRPMPQPTHSHAALTVSNNIYISGGVVASPARVVTADVLRYDPTKDTYEFCAPMHCARRLHAMVALAENSIVYAVGGIGAHHSFHQQTQIPIERYDIASDQWTLLNSSTLAGRSIGHFSLLADDVIISIGREHNMATEDDIWKYDVARDVWSPFIKAPPRTSLASTSCVRLPINFYDEKVAKRLIPERR